MKKERDWKFKIGDIVDSGEFGPGIVTNRRVYSFHEMDRPIRIVEREMYTVCISRDETLKVLRGDVLSHIPDL